MKKYQAGFIVWGLTYFLYTSALIAGIIVIDKSTENQAVAELESPVAAEALAAKAKATPDEM